MFSSVGFPSFNISFNMRRWRWRGKNGWRFILNTKSVNLWSRVAEWLRAGQIRRWVGRIFKAGAQLRWLFVSSNQLQRTTFVQPDFLIILRYNYCRLQTMYFSLNGQGKVTPDLSFRNSEELQTLPYHLGPPWFKGPISILYTTDYSYGISITSNGNIRLSDIVTRTKKKTSRQVPCHWSRATGWF